MKPDSDVEAAKEEMAEEVADKKSDEDDNVDEQIAELQVRFLGNSYLLLFTNLQFMGFKK